MLIYIFKSVACMAIFFIFYKLLLEKENMHVFKRFYLLLAVGASLLIPALVFTEYVVVEPAETITYIETPQNLTSDEHYIGVPAALEKDVLDVEPILWTVYFLGFVFFGLKFIKNLGQIVRRIRKNPKQKSTSFIQVLLKENFPPHTFFKYIFLNKQKLEAKEIPQEVLLHEETHARQKHSLDVIFIELLQVIFWFNPAIYLFKKAIKLNHEFLADQAVLDKDIDKTTYQNTLLSYLSPDSQNKYQSKMVNAINYSSIKKRFTVMKTHTSKKSILLRSLLLFPLLALLIVGFSESRLVETPEPLSEENLAIQEVNSVVQEISEKDRHYEKATFKFRDQNKKVTATKSYKELSEIEKSILVDPLPAPTVKVPSVKQLHDWKDDAKFGIWIDDQRVENEILSNYRREDFKMFFESRLAKNAVNYGKHFFQVNLYTKNGFDKVSRGVSQPLGKDVVIYLTEDNTNKKAEGQGKASAEQMAEYNTLAKKYNAIPIAKRKIPLSDLKLLEAVFKKMNQDQKKSAQPFPECLPQAESDKKFMLNIDNSKIILNGKQVDLESFAKEVDEITKSWEETDYTAVIAIVNFSATPKSFLEKVENEFKKTHFSKANEGSRIFPRGYSKQLNNDGASRKLMAEYNVLAKKYNEMLSKKGSIQIKKKEVDRLKYIYGLMSEKQKADAEPFPDFPPMPDPPAAPKAPKVEKGAKGPIPPTSALRAVNPAQAPEIKKGKVSDIPPPPSPQPAPKPIEPLDHVIAMAKKGAIFYYEGKKVSSDHAIALLKKNKDLNIHSTGNSSKNPAVKISKSPIHIEKEEKRLNESDKEQTTGKSQVLLNGSSKKKLKLKKSEIKTLELTMQEGTITSFKLKIPGEAAQSFIGGQLYAKTKELIENVDSGSSLYLFDLKSTNPNFDNRPISISVL